MVKRAKIRRQNIWKAKKAEEKKGQRMKVKTIYYWAKKGKMFGQISSRIFSLGNWKV
jgi:hypothetical protein